MSARLRVALALLLTVPVVSGGVARGDVVHLRRGGQVVGRVVEDGDAVRVEVRGGTVRLPRSLIREIEYGATDEERFVESRARLPEGDSALALELADVAHGLRLGAEEGELLGLAARWAPEDAAIAARLRSWQVLEREVAPDAAAEERLLQDFGAGARLLRTRHWRIAYDVAEPDVRRRGEMLEVAWRRFHQLTERVGLEPRLLDDRLEALVFRDHARWLAAAGLEAGESRGLSGLFVGATGRILLFDSGTSPSAADAEAETAREVEDLLRVEAQLDADSERLAAARREAAAAPASPERAQGLAAIDEGLAQVAAARTRLRERREELARHRAALAAWWESESLAATTHEACHQIAFQTGIARAGEPVWLSEGLATLFEVTGRELQRLEATNTGRLADLRATWEAGRGGDLAALVDGSRFERAGGDPAGAYAEAWSLAHYLAVRRPAEFARYVRELHPTAPGAGGAAQRLADFRAVFGELADVERAWRAHVERL